MDEDYTFGNPCSPSNVSEPAHWKSAVGRVRLEGGRARELEAFLDLLRQVSLNKRYFNRVRTYNTYITHSNGEFEVDWEQGTYTAYIYRIEKDPTIPRTAQPTEYYAGA